MKLEATALKTRFEGLKQESIEIAVTGLGQALSAIAAGQFSAAQRVPLLEVVRAALPPEIARLAGAYYADRPLPLAPPQQAMVQAMHDLFGKLADQYWQCCEEFEGHTPSTTRERNLAGTLLRCVHTIVSRMIEDYRARQVVSGDTWESLRRVVDKATWLNVAGVQAPDPLNPMQHSTVTSTYGRAVLLAAAHAGAMSARHLDVTLALTALLEPFIDCSWNAEPGSSGDVPWEVQSLEATNRMQMLKKTMRLHVLTTGRVRVIKTSGTTHFLNNSRLAGAVQACRQKLEAGEPVASLDVLPIERTELYSLLARLHRVWCGTAEIRSAPRQAIEADVLAASGVYAIYKLVQGEEFKIPYEFQDYETAKAELSKGEAKVSERADSGDYHAWRMLDHSGEGMRALRGMDGARLARSCLFAVRTQASGGLPEVLLGEVRWVQENSRSSNPGISAGIKRLHGAVRAGVMCGIGGTDGRIYRDVAPVFFLDHEGVQHLVVPNVWWKPERIVEIHMRGTTLKYRMGVLTQRGFDFEMCRYTLEKAAR